MRTTPSLAGARVAVRAASFAVAISVTALGFAATTPVSPATATTPTAPKVHRASLGIDRTNVNTHRVLVRYRSSLASQSSTRRSTESRIAASVQRITRRYQSAPVILADASVAEINRLAANPDVLSIVDDTPSAVTDTESTPLVGATASAAAGTDGAGTTVVVMDTGVDSSHPLLAGKVVAEACFAGTGSCPNGQTTQIGPGSAAPCTYAPSGCRHGTHVAGIAAGRRTASIPFDGVAPAADIIAIQAFTRIDGDICFALGQSSDPCTLTFPSDQIAAMELVGYLSYFYDIPAINMSFGGFLYDVPCDDSPLKPTIDWLRTLGVASVIASGNTSSSDSVSSPGCISTALTIGATTKADAIALFSNSNAIVDIVAPGVAINSSIPGGGTAFFNGTSMATPHVVGALALARQLYPNESLDQLEARLLSNGPQILDPRNNLSFRRLDVLNALRPTEIVPTFAVTNDASTNTMHLTVTLSRASTLPVTVNAVPIAHSATMGSDFTASPQTLTFAPGVTSITYPIKVLADPPIEGTEYMFVWFNSPTNAAVGGFFGLGIGVIVDD